MCKRTPRTHQNYMNYRCYKSRVHSYETAAVTAFTAGETSSSHHINIILTGRILSYTRMIIYNDNNSTHWWWWCWYRTLENNGVPFICVPYMWMKCGETKNDVIYKVKFMYLKLIVLFIIIILWVVCLSFCGCKRR